MKFRPQVPKWHYFSGYDDKKRWMSYWYQINEVLKTKPKSVLEVGVGNKTVSNYLKEKKIKVTTVDIDSSLNPDYVCSVTELTKIFKPETFDVILCAEVLEHLPFEYFKKSLNELYQVTKKWVILSLPYFGFNFCLSLKLSKIGERTLKLKIPLRCQHKFDGQHYWEIGKKGYPLKKILKIILEQNFEIVRTYFPPENMYHLFLVLRKGSK